MILECRSSRREASISFDNDLLTHCISVATAHTAMRAHPGMHDEKTQEWKSAVEKLTDEDYTPWKVTHIHSKICYLLSGRYWSKQQQVDVCSNTKLDFFHPVMKRSVSVAEFSKSHTKLNPLIHCFCQVCVLSVFLHHQRHFNDGRWQKDLRFKVVLIDTAHKYKHTDIYKFRVGLSLIVKYCAVHLAVQVQLGGTYS